MVDCTSPPPLVPVPAGAFRPPSLRSPPIPSFWPRFPWKEPSEGTLWKLPQPPAFLGACKGDARTGALVRPVP